MNIPSSFDPLQPLREAASARPAASAPAAEGSPAAASRPSSDAHGEDTASISPAAVAAASGVSDVRLGKVAAIQQALANGSYRVSASNVASKLLDDMLEG